MQRFQAFKYELMPTGEQQRDMRRFAGACRFVYNKALAWQRAQREAGEKRPGYTALCAALVAWKAQQATRWLSEAPSQALQQSLKNLEAGWERHFKSLASLKKGSIRQADVVQPPVFKRKGRHEKFRFPQGIKLDQANSRVFVPKLGWLRYRNSRDVLGEVRNATVSLSGGKWFVSIQTEREVEKPVPNATSAIGIDMGVARFATMSDGSFLAPLSSFKRHEARLRRAQRAMSRKTKFSSNWRKAKARIQRIHARIGNARLDYLHKASTTISKNHALVSIEDLKVRNMSKSAAGTTEQPGKSVRSKSGLNKAILDQGWYELRRQLEYKLDWNGGWLVAVPPQYTSCTCPCCGHVSAENRQSQARFACVACGYENHADVVGAINVLARGHRVAACGESAQSGHSAKQEPTEATT